MKVLILKDMFKQIKKSGIGKAIVSQERALEQANVDFTNDKNDNYDIVHINTVFPQSIEFAKKCLKRNIPVVYHAHSTMEDFKNSFLLSNQIAPFFKNWIIKCYNTSNIILTPTEYSKSLLKSYGIKKKIISISNGIDINFWKKETNAREEFDNEFNTKGKKIIISVGLYIKRKGILDFVELAKRLPNYEFFWFGYMNLKLVPLEIKKAISTNLPNLHFPGYVNSDKLKKVYSACDLFTFLTYEETEGIVLLEALSCKAKTLIRDIPIYSKSFEDNINIYKGNSIDEFENKIKLILENRLPNLTESGYEIIKDKSLKNVGYKLKNIYEELLIDAGTRYSK